MASGTKAMARILANQPGSGTTHAPAHAPTQQRTHTITHTLPGNAVPERYRQLQQAMEASELQGATEYPVVFDVEQGFSLKTHM